VIFDLSPIRDITEGADHVQNRDAGKSPTGDGVRRDEPGCGVQRSVRAAGVQLRLSDILRRPAGEALDRFAAGGEGLIVTWYAFALTALLLAPAAFALALTPRRLAARPALAVGAAVVGALAGIAQAIGLLRWVFVVPELARVHADPAAAPDAKIAAERAFDLLNQYGGVAIGEHLGQLLTALFVGQVAALQWREAKPIMALIGFLAALTITFGAGEGLAIALGQSGALYSLATIIGFGSLTLWLIVTGLGLFQFGKNTRHA
jgi:hypothetical protein